ncbi:hypothetical protein, partial [Burkholderia sp. ABCPW 14]|uniref:hypothetical protein n=1 Tax=Burkholderia sp. ABCPW 14 TaxID=1637860 RepID=UPI001E317C05
PPDSRGGGKPASGYALRRLAAPANMRTFHLLQNRTFLFVRDSPFVKIPRPIATRNARRVRVRHTTASRPAEPGGPHEAPCFIDIDYGPVQFRWI